MKPIRITYLFPDLLNLYGDGGNVRCLEKRCEWRGLPVEVALVKYGYTVDFDQTDIIFLGGGPDREQQLASQQLHAMSGDLKKYVEAEGVLLAICGGYQILGSEWLLGDETVEGLGIIDMISKRPEGQEKRLIDDVVLSSPLSSLPVVGYENHAGRTFLGAGVKPFGKVISHTGYGNNDSDKSDGVLYRNVLGSYLHGPLLAKNPHIADHLLQSVSDLRQARGQDSFSLEALDDSVEQAANEYMVKRLGVHL